MAPATARHYNWCMRLLVSVRDAAEAHAALAGGADIIDAKEPALGPLAPVSPRRSSPSARASRSAWRSAWRWATPRPRRWSRVVASVAPLQRRAALYFKAAVISSGPTRRPSGIAAACRHARDAARIGRALIVARYVDRPADASVPRPDGSRCVRPSGARGLLLDTSRKHGPNLFGSVGRARTGSAPEQAARARHLARHCGGCHRSRAWRRLGVVQPDVLGVRGAVCEGTKNRYALGRAGR